METMRFKFKIQLYQTDAVESVADVFAGQPAGGEEIYRVDRNTDTLDLSAGYRNREVELSESDLFQNIHRVQSRNNIPLSGTISKGLGACSLDVEMETGTGKTYVYIKTIFELNKRYGWSKFIIVVPSIAIREGVKKSFQMTEDHFMETYGKKARYFIYDSSRLTEIDNFSESRDIHVMIINMQAFNSSFEESKNKEGRGGNAAARIIFSKDEDFGFRRPIDVIAANHPILILDEPQKMGGEKTQKALRLFKPLFCLNYSATHKVRHNLVYVLDALDAYNKKLVKRIQVKGVELSHLSGSGSYLFFSEIMLSKKAPPAARVEMEIGYKKGIRREARVLHVDDDLYAMSHQLEEYKGYRVNEIDPFKNTLSFTNGVVLHAGEAAGDVAEKDIRRIQIRETIRSHFEREKELFPQGIKVLSLFFIDEVAKYRKYDEEGKEVPSEYGTIFEEEYRHVYDEFHTILGTPYDRYLEGIPVEKTHTGYFSIDKQKHAVDSKAKGKEGISDDVSAYDLIMKDKERLLSLNEPVRFIFSHSALREGWDNPNIFQICTLKHGGDSPSQKRQEVGRGLRLCVNQQGERMDASVLGQNVQEVNLLTVVASDGYKQFVEDLQADMEENLFDRPRKASPTYFLGKTVSGQEEGLSEEQSQGIYFYLVKQDYVDEKGHITEKYRSDSANGNLAPLPDKLAPLGEDIHRLIQSIFDPSALADMIGNGHSTKIRENGLNENFYKKEFQALWERIHHRYAYTVHFDSAELIAKARDAINAKLAVSPLIYAVTRGTQNERLDADAVKARQGFVTKETRRQMETKSEKSMVRYDLVGSIAKETTLTRRTVVRILQAIGEAKFNMFRKNPEEFIKEATKLINEQKAAVIVDHITYNPSDEAPYTGEIFTAEKHTDFSKARRVRKNVQDYLFTDGYAKDGGTVESHFADDLEHAAEVCVYAKLPSGFTIPTPVGNYSPDWAIAFKEGTVKHIFFVAETKGSMNSMELKEIEQAKIRCAKTLFHSLSTKDVIYEQVHTYDDLLRLMNS